jgi:hypothetical protein
MVLYALSRIIITIMILTWFKYLWLGTYYAYLGLCAIFLDFSSKIFYVNCLLVG